MRNNVVHFERERLRWRFATPLTLFIERGRERSRPPQAAGPLSLRSSVKAAGTIVAHHIAVLVGLLVPYWRPATHGYALGLCMSVEFQTSILITRRLLIGATFPGAAALRAVVRVVFYMSWLSIRCMLYPWLAIVVFPPDYLADVEKHGTYFTVLLIEPILCLGLTLLNAQWSYELFTGLYKRRLAPDDKAHFL